jgi:hypothetical protein
VHVVALCEIKGPLEAEAAALAPLFGVGPYDVRVWMSGVMPRVVMMTPDYAAAVDTHRTLRARGHGAVIFDAAAVVPGTHMVQVHRFSTDDASLWANDGEGDFLPWDMIGAIVVVARRVEVVRTTRVRAPAATSIPARSRPTVETLERSREHLTDHVAYLFPREGGVPWLVREQETQYLSLGPRMKLTRYENFRETLALVRSKATRAIFDERFARDPRAAAQVIQVQGHESATPEASDSNVDILVHALAEWLLRGQGGPYRQASRLT